MCVITYTNKNIYVRYNNEAGFAEAHQTMDPANYKGAMPNTGNDQTLMNITFTYINKTLQNSTVICHAKCGMLI